MGRAFDVRTPAQPQDFETTVSLMAMPPVEFTVTRLASSNQFHITDRQRPTGTGGATAYRIYYLPGTVAPTIDKMNTASLRASGLSVATMVMSVEALGKGTVLTANDTTTFGKTGWFWVVAVNERGDESPVEQMVAAP